MQQWQVQQVLFVCFISDELFEIHLSQKQKLYTSDNDIHLHLISKEQNESLSFPFATLKLK